MNSTATLLRRMPSARASWLSPKGELLWSLRGIKKNQQRQAQAVGRALGGAPCSDELDPERISGCTVMPLLMSWAERENLLACQCQVLNLKLFWEHTSNRSLSRKYTCSEGFYKPFSLQAPLLVLSFQADTPEMFSGPLMSNISSCVA